MANAALEHALAELDRMGRERADRDAKFSADPINARLRQLAEIRPIKNGGMAGAQEVFRYLTSTANAKRRMAIALLASRRCSGAQKHRFTNEIANSRREAMRRAAMATGHRTGLNAGVVADTDTSRVASGYHRPPILEAAE